MIRGTMQYAHSLWFVPTSCSPSPPSIRSWQIGRGLVWEDSSAASISSQATTSPCIDQTCMQSPPAVLDKIEFLTHPSEFDQSQTLYPLFSCARAKNNRHLNSSNSSSSPNVTLISTRKSSCEFKQTLFSDDTKSFYKDRRKNSVFFSHKCCIDEMQYRIALKIRRPSVLSSLWRAKVLQWALDALKETQNIIFSKVSSIKSDILVMALFSCVLQLVKVNR